MEAIHVRAAISDYDVIVGHNVLTRFSDFVAAFDPGGELVVVTDDEVDRHFQEFPQLPRSAQRVVLRHGEHLKTFAEAESLISQLAEWNVGRDGMIVVLGGGVIGDLAGFVASIYLRGIPWAVVPTTLLSQVDSAVGGKVAVNLPVGKNLVGAFYPPRLVLCDIALLSELPDKEFISGLGEVIKTALIGDPQLFEMLEDQLDNVLSRDPKVLENMVTACAKVKADVVSRDERDRGIRAMLNFGHTIAHALEGAEGFEALPHGIAVLCGILVTLPLSKEFCGLSDAIINRIQQLIQRLPIDNPESLPPFEAVKTFIAHDKKTRKNEAQWVLLKDIGVPISNVTVPMELVQTAYSTLRGNQ